LSSKNFSKKNLLFEAEIYVPGYAQNAGFCTIYPRASTATPGGGMFGHTPNTSLFGHAGTSGRCCEINTVKRDSYNSPR
jgi:hypothetical protein